MAWMSITPIHTLIVLVLVVIAISLVVLRLIVKGHKRHDAPTSVAQVISPLHIVQSHLGEIGEVLQEYSSLWELAAAFQQLAIDVQQPLMVVVMGQFKTGKSTFLNALLGQELLKSDVTPATAAVTLLRYGEYFGVKEPLCR